MQNMFELHAIMNLTDMREVYAGLQAALRFARPHEGTLMAMREEWECLSQDEQREASLGILQKYMQFTDARMCEEDVLCAWENQPLHEKLALFKE
jgi:hypothetical protein